MTAMDVAGTVDPTGVLDLAAATIYAFQGDFVNASISAASILPAGDLLKASRIATKGATKLLGPGTKFGEKIADQLTERGWTKALVQSTIDNPIRTAPRRDTRHLPGGSRMNEPATAYYGKRGGYVVRNNRTGDIVQVSDRTNSSWLD
jgi:hypothetical protein